MFENENILNELNLDESEKEVSFAEYEIYDYFNNRIKTKNELKVGMAIKVYEDNTMLLTIVDSVTDNGFIPGKVFKSSYFMDVYIFNEKTNKFEFLETGDPEEMLEEDKFEEGDVVYLAIHGTKDPAYIEDTSFSDIFGIYMITETIDSYIDSCNEIYFQNNSEDEEPDDMLVELSFVPIKPFFLYMKDKHDFFKSAKAVFNNMENGSIKI